MLREVNIPFIAARDALEKEGDRHLKQLRYVLKTAGADPVLSLLVFLHLLESYLESLAQLFLAQLSTKRRIPTRPPTCLSTSRLIFSSIFFRPYVASTLVLVDCAANAAERPNSRRIDQLLDPFESPERNNSLTDYAARERFRREHQLVAAYVRDVCAIAHSRVGAGLKVQDDFGAIHLVCASICDESIEQSCPVDVGRI
jgi:hypothetical protein